MSVNNEDAARQLFVMTIHAAEKSKQSVMRTINKTFQKHASKKNLLVSGKQPLKKLMKHNSALQSAELHDKDLKRFKRTAKKYNIDFAVKKDPHNKNKYYLFFKAKDESVLNMAFNEFAEKAVNAKDSVKEQIQQSKDIANEINQERAQNQDKNMVKEKVKNNEIHR